MGRLLERVARSWVQSREWEGKRVKPGSRGTGTPKGGDGERRGKGVRGGVAKRGAVSGCDSCTAHVMQGCEVDWSFSQSVSEPSALHLCVSRVAGGGSAAQPGLAFGSERQAPRSGEEEGAVEEAQGGGRGMRRLCRRGLSGDGHGVRWV